MNQGREQLWARAVALDALAEPRLSARARWAAQRHAAAVDFADVAATPDWAGWPAARRERYLRLVGAAAVAPFWRSCIDGEVLRLAAESIGEAAFDALLEMADGEAIPDEGARSGAAIGLARLGASVLLGRLAERPALAARLGEALGARSHPSAGHAQTAVAAADALLREETP